jgi:hypothetical protein
VSTRLALIFGAFILAGVVQLFIARWLTGKARALQARGKRADGRRVDSSTHVGAGGRASRHDVVAFATEDGRTVEVTSRIGVPWSVYKDRPVPVLYDPANPDDAVIETWTEQWAPAVLFGLNGGLMLLGALIGVGLVYAGVLPNA